MTANTAKQAATPLPEVGDVLDGRYEIQAVLGEGGMGHVFRALDRERGTEVALKVIIPRYLGRKEREERFLRELELGLRVEEHPHLVQMLDGGRLTETGWPFIVMALCPGQALNHRLALGPLPPPIAARAARQLAGAVRALHCRGVVHRDITPMNVLIDGNELVLIDLSHAGDAAAPSAAVGQRRRLTRENEVPGTVLYMSPEQARAEPAQLAMDVYAFGVTLAQMLVGPTLDDFSREEFLSLQREAKIKPPRIDLRIHTMVPPRLAELVDACTASDPTTRPSMERVVEWLDGVLASMSIPADVSGPAFAARAVAVVADDEPENPTVGYVAHRAPPPVNPPPMLDDPVTGEDWETGRTDAPLEDPPERSRGVWAITLVTALLVVALVLGLMAWWWTSNNDLNPSGDPQHDNDGAVGVEETGPSSAGAPPMEPEGPGTALLAEQEPAQPEPTTGPEPEPRRPEPEPRGPEPVAEPSPTAEPKAPRKRKPSRPSTSKDEPGAPVPTETETQRPAETEDCIAHRAQTEQAAKIAAWTKVAKLARRRECWSDQAERKRLRVRALFETQSWEACVSEGRGVNEPQTKQWVDLCQRHVD